MRGVATLLGVVAITVAQLGEFGSASTSVAPGMRYTSERYGFSVSVPAGWHRSRARLVPKLLMPREILSVGTSQMPVGQGGSCGREPTAAIERMQPGDALVSIQEYTVTAAMRSRLGGSSAPPSLDESLAELNLRKELRRPGERAPNGDALWSSTLPFTEHGRWFDALVYVKGDPAPARVGQIRSILHRLQLDRGTFVRRG